MPQPLNATPLQYSCLENPRDGGAWWAAIYEDAQSQTRLKRLSSSSSSMPQPLMPKSWNWMVLWRSTRPLELIPHRGLECKSRKSRDTWSNRQVWHWSTKWGRAKTNRVWPRERTGHCKHPLPTKQEKTLHMDMTRWSTPKSYWQYSLQPEMEKLYTVNKNKTRSWLWLRSWTPYCQIQTYIEESRENQTTRPFRYDLNQIHTVLQWKLQWKWQMDSRD